MESATSTSSSILGLFVICSAMFAGAFVAGLSCYKLNRRQLAWLNCFAAGLLLGTALGVIIPEGVRSIYESGHEVSGVSAHEIELGGHKDEHGHGHEHAGSEAHNEGQHSERLLGWTLILGFLTMMVADDVFATCTGAAGGSHGHSHGLDAAEHSPALNPGGSPIKLPANASSTASLKDAEECKHTEPADSNHLHEKHETISAARRRNTVTLGLLIHNAMDGLAMGAARAAMTSSTTTQTVVFWAIMMHHVPASFGYATYLRNSGMEEHVVRRFVTIFSLAAPLSAALTFFALHPDYLGFFAVSSRAVGTCLLFSAGTFLNVACVHALEEAKRGFPRWGLKQALVLCLGAVVPGIASWNHEH